MSINFVTALAVKSFDVPDKKRCPDKAEFDLCHRERLLGGPADPRARAGGGRRTPDPYEQTDVCLHHHLGFCISGEMEVETAEGLRSTIHANDTYAIPPGHDEWVVGPNRSWPWNSWVRRPSGAAAAGACTPGSDFGRPAAGSGRLVRCLARHGRTIHGNFGSMRVALCPVAKGSGWPMLSIVEASNTDTPQILEGHKWLTTLVLAVPHAFRVHSASL